MILEFTSTLTIEYFVIEHFFWRLGQGLLCRVLCRESLSGATIFGLNLKMSKEPAMGRATSSFLTEEMASTKGLRQE